MEDARGPLAYGLLKEEPFMMKRALQSGLALMLACALPAFAGKNDGGVMVVHTNDAYSYSAGTACNVADAEPQSCEEVVAQSNLTEGAVIWLLALFHADATPGVSVVYFGIDYDEANLDPGGRYKFCGPAGTLEVQDDDWPYTGRGNSVAFGTPVVGDLVFPFYVFEVNGGLDGSYFSVTTNPTGGYASFVDDEQPPGSDLLTQEQFGTLRWNAPGDVPCPTPPRLGACCLSETATCELFLTEAACINSPGVWLGTGTACEGLQCGACCYWLDDGGNWRRRCVVTSQQDCEVTGPWNDHQENVGGQFVGANWGVPGIPCALNAAQADSIWWCADPRDPNDPYFPVEPSTWGRLKAIFR